jgi:hypothetical protein
MQWWRAKSDPPRRRSHRRSIPREKAATLGEENADHGPDRERGIGCEDRRDGAVVELLDAIAEESAADRTDGFEDRGRGAYNFAQRFHRKSACGVEHCNDRTQRDQECPTLHD